MGYSGGVHVNMLWWLHSATWLSQEELRWGCCDDYVIEHEPFARSSRENSDESIIQHGLFEKSSLEKSTAIQSSKMRYSGGIQERMLYWLYCPTWAIRRSSWFRNPTWAIWKEFTWECYGDFIFKNKSFWRSSREHLWRFNSSRWPIDSGGIHVRMRWRFHSATWVIQGHITL
jgi:hypothetical protein